MLNKGYCKTFIEHLHVRNDFDHICELSASWGLRRAWSWETRVWKAFCFVLSARKRQKHQRFFVSPVTHPTWRLVTYNLHNHRDTQASIHIHLSLRATRKKQHICQTAECLELLENVNRRKMETDLASLRLVCERETKQTAAWVFSSANILLGRLKVYYLSVGGEDMPTSSGQTELWSVKKW